MNTQHWIRHPRGWRVLPMVLTFAVVTLAGCLGEPKIDERWTLLEFVEVSPRPGQTAPAGQPLNVTVRSRITYRNILTGFLVAEVRYSDTVLPSSVKLEPTKHTLETAKDVDYILANSVTAGRATKIVTGFDHLMQDVALSFSAQWSDTAVAGGYYLLLYMGEGEEIRLRDGRDSLVVTPFVSTDREILHTGFPLEFAPPAGGP